MGYEEIQPYRKLNTKNMYKHELSVGPSPTALICEQDRYQSLQSWIENERLENDLHHKRRGKFIFILKHRVDRQHPCTLVTLQLRIYAGNNPIQLS